MDVRALVRLRNGVGKIGEIIVKRIRVLVGKDNRVSF